MDDFSTGGLELREALSHLRVLNRIFGASAPTFHGVRKLWEEAGRPDSFTILDIGAGSGDVNGQILKWADLNGIDLRITLVDITEEACEEARHYFRDEPRIQVLRSNLFDLQEQFADVVTGTQFVHHFAENELNQVIHKMLHVSRLGVVINDIHRHWIPWVAVWITVRLISSNRYIHHDGPLSVAKGFCAEDWKQLRQALELPGMRFSWKPLFRYMVVIGKSSKNLK